MTEAAPLVAVVTPVYNGGRYLDETMACVQAQTYSNLVHVVLDNASVDNTPDVIARYATAKVPLLAAKNPSVLPLQDNWNAAVALAPANAKYIRVLCADDLMAPDAVEKMVAAAERHPTISLVGCRQHTNGPTEPDNWPRDRELFDAREALSRVLLGDSMLIATHTLMRTDAVPRGEPLFKRGLVASDTQTCLKILTRGDWGFVHEDLAMTRVHQESMTSALVSGTEIHVYDWLMLLKEFGPYAFGPERANAVLDRYRRNYRRKLLRWRREGRDAVFAKHMAKLAEVGEAPSLLQNADAMIDWAGCKLGLRERWTGYPFFA